MTTPTFRLFDFFGLWNKTNTDTGTKDTHKHIEREKHMKATYKLTTVFVWHFVVFERIPFSVFAELRCAPVLVLVRFVLFRFVLLRFCSVFFSSLRSTPTNFNLINCFLTKSAYASSRMWSELVVPAIYRLDFWFDFDLDSFKRVIIIVNLVVKLVAWAIAWVACGVKRQLRFI